MADHEHSPAYLALTPAGRRVLHVIESEVERGMASISLNDFTQRFGCSRRGTVRPQAMRAAWLRQHRHGTAPRQRVRVGGWLEVHRPRRGMAVGAVGKAAEAAARVDTGACADTEAGEATEAGGATAHARAPDAVNAGVLVGQRRSIDRR